ncbi:MAG: sigma-54-dependent Fis family transcriptional regulator [Desulfarculus sp.]|nr:sigma-54-dependent Fis family transcriptional regulator [Desulfarculus sp.]
MHSPRQDPGPVLFIDDEATMRTSVRQWLELAGLACQDFDRAQKALDTLSPGFARMVLTDVKKPGMDGLALQRAVFELDPDIPVVLVTAHGDITMAVESMRAGAYDFIEKPFDPERILDVVRRALEKRRLVLENRELRQDLAAAEGLDARLMGSSPSMRALKREIVNIAPTKANVLLVGETGTGKEVVARCLHELSPRRSHPFLAVNCAAIPQQLAESELFGHERGAFTGATHPRVGKLEAASGGTLFLDEISSMPLEVQGKLLRVLQDREVLPIGSNTPRPVDFRLVSATNEYPQEAIRNARLREDLYYRLSTVEWVIPPLRERKEDVPMLFSLFLDRAANTYDREVQPPSAEQMLSLMRHAWPGNVRELKNLAERYALSSLSALSTLPGFWSASGAVRSAPATPLAEQVQLFERQIIKDAIKRHQGDMREVMAELSLPLRTLNEKMAKYGLLRHEDRG